MMTPEDIWTDGAEQTEETEAPQTAEEPSAGEEPAENEPAAEEPENGETDPNADPDPEPEPEPEPEEMPIEAVVISYLSEALETSDVYAERPQEPPDEYYIIERTSGAEINHIQRATIAVQSISAASMLRAAQMNQRLMKVMPGIVQAREVCSCRLNSAYNYTDTEMKEYRYQAVFDLYYYMEGV